jgi:hypothetical protein
MNLAPFVWIALSLSLTLGLVIWLTITVQEAYKFILAGIILGLVYVFILDRTFSFFHVRDHDFLETLYIWFSLPVLIVLILILVLNLFLKGLKRTSILLFFLFITEASIVLASSHCRVRPGELLSFYLTNMGY